ncbi:uncharacterized protein EV422DRAFT_526082 [Fimicolochytrium jonesii]|uniref:uncharacterized protein n=1 Tax=Fimicolochytrium jonesii TaxID=1396493 RepID=UPI0022FE6959|nr:uncharacterized protein EV422DRAFT_526082 [Fimicolochytrium jonesii]KAI8822214.1 hypothetical protein EV422DRAFT_526082 [Fimicolochytrium jonesii]
MRHSFFACRWRRRRQQLTMISAILPFLLLPSATATATPKFSTSGLFDVQVELGEGVDGMIAAFGDVNGDKFTDIFTLNTAQTHVVAHQWDHGSFKFRKILNSELSFDPQNPTAVTIVNVVPGDYNYDGKLDVLLMGQKTAGADQIEMRVFYGDGMGGFNASSFMPLDPATHLQPFAANYDGTMKPQFLGQAAGTKAGMLALWSPVDNGAVSSVALNSTTTSMCKLKDPHSNAFVDFNGDCMADLFLTCDDGSFQIWLNTDTNGFTFSQAGKLPAHAGQVTFADIDADGTIDMVFPTCVDWGGDCFIHVAYNQQIPLCAAGDDGTHCRDPHNLCTADDKFTFDFTEDSKAYVKLPLSPLLPKDRLVLTLAPVKSHPPIPLRIGDFNNDGYPDLLASTTNGVRLLRSVPCHGDVCGNKATDAGRRAFEVVQGAEVLAGKGAEGAFATFVDLDEDGTLDILVSTVTKGVYHTHAIFNNFYNDAFFLKGLVSNGVCPAWCPTGDRFPSPKPYGVNYVGASFKYTVFDTAGRRRATQAAQLPQSSYFSLQTPYALFGLGRTNNYIEDLFVGVSRRKGKISHVGTFQGVIPNSQLVVIPYEEDEGAGPGSWILELYINPSSASSSVLLVLCTSLALLASVVGVLHWTEKREDAKERRRARHAINFDAL